MCNGIARSNVSLHESVKSVRCTVSISSARQPFARICKGKYKYTAQVIRTYQNLYRFHGDLQDDPVDHHKHGAQDDLELRSKVSKLFKGTIHDSPFFLACVWVG